jgi:hypothetical protein
MIASNSGVDFISATKLAGANVTELLASPEFKDWMLEHLAESEVTVTFTKKDGSDRVLRCTRNVAVIPAEHAPKNEKPTAIKTDAIAAFDLDINEWRSFNLSAVKRIEWDLNA